MKHTNKTAGETANTITFERGDISPQHVAELRKDAAVGVAYNFITDQISRRRQP